MKKNIEYYQEKNEDNPLPIDYKLSLTQIGDRVLRVGDTIIDKRNKQYEIAAFYPDGMRAYLAAKTGYVIAESDFLDEYELPEEKHRRLSKLRELKLRRILQLDE